MTDNGHKGIRMVVYFQSDDIAQNDEECKQQV